MELTRQNFEKRLEYIKRIYEEEGEEFETLRKSLKEKGVECAIVSPLIEIVLGFDIFKDVKFEKESKKMNNQKFDFLIKDEFIIEVKSLGEKLESGPHENQIRRYIRENDDINYGIITNGVDYQVWMQKEYINYASRYDNTSDLLPHPDKKVIKIFEFGIDNNPDNSVEGFIHICESFNRDNYKRFFDNSAKLISKIVRRAKGKNPVLNSVRSANDFIVNKIRENCIEDRGFYEAKDSGKKIYYNDPDIVIAAEIQENGFLKIMISECGIKSYKSAKDRYPNILEMLSKWEEGEYVYKSPLDIIKDLRGMQKLHKQKEYIRKFVIK